MNKHSLRLRNTSRSNITYPYHLLHFRRTKYKGHRRSQLSRLATQGMVVDILEAKSVVVGKTDRDLHMAAKDTIGARLSGIA